MDAQNGCGLSCTELSLLSEMSPLIGRHSAVQPKDMGLLKTHTITNAKIKLSSLILTVSESSEEDIGGYRMS